MSNYSDTLKKRFGETSIKTSEFRDNRRVIISGNLLFEVMKCLKEDCGFDMLAEIAGVDYLNYPNATDRYGVIYGLTNTSTGERLFVKTFANDPEPRLASVYALWKGADWMEREVYDMFGVIFEGHPDLRRILMPEECTSFPLRKDYPLRGRGERHNFPVLVRSES